MAQYSPPNRSSLGFRDITLFLSALLLALISTTIPLITADSIPIQSDSALIDNELDADEAPIKPTVLPTPVDPPPSSDSAKKLNSDSMRAMYRFSDPIPTTDWLNVFSVLFSYQQVAVSHRFGPYGIHREDAEYMKMMKEDVPEMRNLFTKPQIFDSSNFKTTVTPPPQDILQHLTITQINSNIPYKKIEDAVKDKQQAMNSATKFDHRTLELTSDGLYIPSLAAHNAQADTFDLVSNLLTSSSPYIRVEVVSEHQDVPEKFAEWLQNYNSNNNLDHVLLKYSINPRTTGGYNLNTPRQYHMIIYIEPDQLVQFGKHFSRMSDHGNNTGILLLVIMAIIIGSQLGFQYWEQTALRSYNQFIVVALWLVPLGVALLDNFRRFLIIWWCYTCFTALVLSLLFIDLNPIVNKFLSALDSLSDDDDDNYDDNNADNGTNLNSLNSPSPHPNPEFPNTNHPTATAHGKKQKKKNYIIPQRSIFSVVYKYFLLVHKFIMLLATLSVIVFFLDVFGIFQLLGLEPHMVGEMFKGHEATAAEVLTFIMFAFYGVFYSLYFGVLNREIATIVIPELTLWSSRFKSSRELRSKQLSGGIDGDTDVSKNNSNNNNNKEGNTTQVSNIEMVSLGNHAPRDRKHHPDNANQFGFGDDEEGSGAGRTWDNVGSILGQDGGNDNNNSTTRKNDKVINLHNFTEDDDFFTKSTPNQPLHPQSTQTKSKSSIGKENSCGICHEHIKKNNSPDPSNSNNSTNTNDDLPTITEIRNRLRRQNLNGSTSSSSGASKFKDPQALLAAIQTLTLTLLSTIVFGIIEISDYLTGGSGNVNVDSVTFVDGMYTISASAIEKNKKQRVDAERYDHEYDDLLEEEDTASSLTRGGGGFASNTQSSVSNGGNALDASSLQTQDNIIFKLPCGCIVHDICLRGFMLLGKHNTCPSCNEISTFDVFVSPWDNVYDNYKNFLDTVKYVIAVNPLLLFVINILLYFFW